MPTGTEARRAEAWADGETGVRGGQRMTTELNSITIKRKPSVEVVECVPTSTRAQADAEMALAGCFKIIYPAQVTGFPRTRSKPQDRGAVIIHGARRTLGLCD